MNFSSFKKKNNGNTHLVLSLTEITKLMNCISTYALTEINKTT